MRPETPSSGAPASDIDLGARRSIVDPAGYFGPWIEHGDVHWSDVHRGWVVLGHAAVADAFKEGELLSADRVTTLERVAASRPEEFRSVVEILSSWMIFRDPPEHTRLRAPVRAAFTARRVADLGPLIDEIVDQAIDDMVAGAVDGAGDLTDHLAKPVPALVIGALLGVEPADRPRLQAWSDDLATLVFSLDPRSTPSASLITAARGFRDLFGRLVEDRRGDDSLVGHIAAADDAFDAAELISMCTMLLFAGHETTTSLIQNAVATLLERPDLLSALRADPAVLPTAVEELLRVQGPGRTMIRKVAVAHERGGHRLEPRQVVHLSVAAANHDPRAFDRPEILDISRDPNPHLSFGWGLHHCLGATLARAEAVTVLSHLLARFPDLRAAGPIPPLDGSTMGFGRGPVTIAVTRPRVVRSGTSPTPRRRAGRPGTGAAAQVGQSGVPSTSAATLSASLAAGTPA
jgi:cytochrome P450